MEKYIEEQKAIVAKFEILLDECHDLIFLRDFDGAFEKEDELKELYIELRECREKAGLSNDTDLKTIFDELTMIYKDVNENTLRWFDSSEMGALFSNAVYNLFGLGEYREY